MTVRHAKTQPHGFTNRIEKAPIVEVSQYQRMKLHEGIQQTRE